MKVERLKAVTMPQGGVRRRLEPRMTLGIASSSFLSGTVAGNAEPTPGLDVDGVADVAIRNDHRSRHDGKVLNVSALDVQVLPDDASALVLLDYMEMGTGPVPNLVNVLHDGSLM